MERRKMSEARTGIDGVEPLIDGVNEDTAEGAIGGCEIHNKVRF